MTIWCMFEDSEIIRIGMPWAKSLSRMWRFNAFDFEAEKRYNLKMSQRKPFCAVCSVLNRRDDVSMANFMFGKATLYDA